MTLDEFLNELTKTQGYFNRGWSKEEDRQVRIYERNKMHFCPITAVCEMMKSPVESYAINHYKEAGRLLGLITSDISKIAAAADLTPSSEWFDENLRERILTAVGLEYDTIQTGPGS